MQGRLTRTRKVTVTQGPESDLCLSHSRFLNCFCYLFYFCDQGQKKVRQLKIPTRSV